MLVESTPIRVALLALLGVAALGPALTAGVSWDDGELLSDNPAIRSLERPWRFFTDVATQTPYGGDMAAVYRPLRTLGYALQFAVFGGDAWGYHLVSLLLHALGAFAVGVLAIVLFGRGGWVAAGVWLVHPVLAEPAVSLAAQANLVCLGGVVLAVVAYVKGSESGRWPWTAASLAFAALAMLSYEFGVLVPALLLLVEGLLWRGGRRLRGTLLARLAPHVALAAAYLAVRSAVVPAMAPRPWWGGGWPETLVMQLQIWLEALRISTLPFGALPRLMPDDVAGIPAPLAVAVHLALAAFCVWAVRRGRATAAAAAVAWWYLAQGPTSNLLTPNPGFPFAPRFLFLALALPVAVLGAWLEGQAARRPAVWALAAAGAVVLIPAARATVAVFSSPRAYFARLVEARPDDYVARLNLGLAMMRTGDFGGAATHLRRAQAIDPTRAEAYSVLGQTYRFAGRTDDAEQQLREALARRRLLIPALIAFAEIELAKGNAAYVCEGLRPVAARDDVMASNLARVNAVRARACSESGDCESGRAAVARALELAPTMSATLLTAARALVACGDRVAARDLLASAADAARREVLDRVGESAF